MIKIEELKKIYEKMGSYELENGYASYKTVIDRFIGDLVLCNKITEVDYSVYENMNNNAYYYVDKNGDYRTKKEYENDENGEIEQEYCDDIYQWFLCNLNEFKVEQLEKAGVILSYSDLLECDVLCVDHWGTSWSYVLTNVKLFDDYEDLKKYEEESETNENEW